MTDALAPISAAVTPSLMASPTGHEVDQPHPLVLSDRAPHVPKWIRKVSLGARGRHGDAGASEHLARALLPLRAREAEEHGLRGIGSGGDEQVSLELLREPVAGLCPPVEL